MEIGDLVAVKCDEATRIWQVVNKYVDGTMGVCLPTGEALLVTRKDLWTLDECAINIVFDMIERGKAKVVDWN